MHGAWQGAGIEVQIVAVACLIGGRRMVAQAAGGHQLLCVSQVRVWVAAAKVLLGIAVEQARRVCAQLLWPQIASQ